MGMPWFLCNSGFVIPKLILIWGLYSQILAKFGLNYCQFDQKSYISTNYKKPIQREGNYNNRTQAGGKDNPSSGHHERVGKESVVFKL
jgi:hypothetical protein